MRGRFTTMITTARLLGERSKDFSQRGTRDRIWSRKSEPDQRAYRACQDVRWLEVLALSLSGNIYSIGRGLSLRDTGTAAWIEFSFPQISFHSTTYVGATPATQISLSLYRTNFLYCPHGGSEGSLHGRFERSGEEIPMEASNSISKHCKFILVEKKFQFCGIASSNLLLYLT
jgi:hypothetical protein